MYLVNKCIPLSKSVIWFIHSIMLVFRFAIVCYVLICFSSRSSSINIINQTHYQYQMQPSWGRSAWETGFLSIRHGYCNRWRQSNSRWTLQGKLQIIPIHIPIQTSYINTFGIFTVLEIFIDFIHLHTDLFMPLILLLFALLSFRFF